jgi:hypothetical protein
MPINFMPWHGALMWSYFALLFQMAIFPDLVLYSSYIPENVGVNQKDLNKKYSHKKQWNR